MTRVKLEAAPSEPDDEAMGGEGGATKLTLRVRGEARSVHLDDVDDVIGLAAELKQQASDRLTSSDLEDIGRELDIEPIYVRKAVEALLARQAQQEKDADERAKAAARTTALRKRRLMQVAIALGSLFFVLFVGIYSKQSSLSDAKAQVDQKAAQVDNVMERQATVKARYQGASPGPERDAMLDGAENRVRIERKRYDEAAAAYNAEAGGVLAGLAAGLFGLPERVPLSNEVERW